MKKINYYQYMNQTHSEAYKLNWEVQFLGLCKYLFICNTCISISIIMLNVFIYLKLCLFIHMHIFLYFNTHTHIGLLLICLKLLIFCIAGLNHIVLGTVAVTENE